MIAIEPVLAATAVAGLFAVSAAIAVRRGAHPGVGPFVAFALLLSTAAAIGGGWLAGVDLPYPFLLASLWLFAIVAWVVLVFEYTGRGPALTARLLVAIVGFAAVAVLSLVLTVSLFEEIPAAFFAANAITQRLLIGALAYGGLLVGVSALQYRDLSTGGQLFLATTGTAVLLSGSVRGLGEEGLLDPAAELWASIAVLGGLGIVVLGIQVRYRPFTTDPSTGYLARETVLDWIDDAVLIGDRRDRLFDYNTAAEALFAIEEPDELGRPIGDLFGGDSPDLFEDVPPGSAGEASFETTAGRRRFEVYRHRIGDDRDTPIGRAYRLRDVTDRRTHEERLDVLNRIVRHNLRNDLDAIGAFAAELERTDAGSGDAAQLADRIRSIATELATLGEKVDRAETLLARDTLDRESIDVVACVRDVAESIDDRIELRADERVRIRTDERFLRAAVAELLDNALAHSDRDEPHVAVSIRRGAEDVHIEVADDGPGIPDRERETLLEGEETPLRHGSGIGLWMVHWTVRRMGGTIAFAENEPRGSVVTIAFPIA